MKRIVGFLLCMVLFLSLCGCNSQDYKKAMALYQDGDFSSAKAIFDKLGNYDDAAKMSKDCSYNMAIELLSAGAYLEAHELFAALGEYEDSAEYDKQAKWGMLYLYIKENGEPNSDLESYALSYDISSEEEKESGITCLVHLSAEDANTMMVSMSSRFDTGKVSFVKVMALRLVRENTEGEWYYYWFLGSTGYTNQHGYAGTGKVNVDTCTADTSLEFDAFYSIKSDGTMTNDKPDSTDTDLMTELWADLIGILPEVLTKTNLPINMKDLGFLAS